MAFQLKDFYSITASMVNYIRGTLSGITDFNPGSAARTLLEAPAIEMDQLYQEMFVGIREGVETGIFRSFELPLFDGETFQARQARFARFVQSLSKATVSAIEAGAETAFLVNEDNEITERVVMAKAYEPFEDDLDAPVGFTICYIHNGVGETSSELVEHTQKIIDGYIDEGGNPVVGWKGSGLPCDIVAATDVPVDADYQIAVTGVSDVPGAIAAASAAISDYIQGLRPGKDFDPYCAASAVRLAGVTCVKAITPTDPVVVGVSGKAIPGTITVTAVEE
jgi:hypothetical protein